MLVLNKKFEKTLNDCMYFCYDDNLYWELQFISMKLITGRITEEDCNRLYEIEKEIKTF